MPGQEVSEVAMRVIELLGTGALLGWALALVFALGWFVHAKRQRQVIVKEMARLSDERDRWQQKFIDGKVISSED